MILILFTPVAGSVLGVSVALRLREGATFDFFFAGSTIDEMGFDSVTLGFLGRSRRLCGLSSCPIITTSTSFTDFFEAWSSTTSPSGGESGCLRLFDF
jgi:hypothetical protein